MATLKEEALAYEPKLTKNIAELSSVSTDLQLEDREGTDKEGSLFKYKVAVVLMVLITEWLVKSSATLRPYLKRSQH